MNTETQPAVTGPLDGRVRRVVCAALRAADGEVLLGVRHYSTDMHIQIERRIDGEKFMHRHDKDQGFVDQHGVYMDRQAAYFVAAKAEQITNFDACDLIRCELYSEGLY